MSAEGVEPVAWAVIDKDGAFWDAAPLSSKEYADKRAAVLNRTRDGYPTPYTVVPLYAHPAATAREEAWKAMVAYIECEDAYKNASKSNDWMAPLTAAGWDGKSNPRPLINRLRTRALALARSTGGERA